MIVIIWLDKLTLGQDDLSPVLNKAGPQYPRTRKSESIRLCSLCFLSVFVLPQVLNDCCLVSILSRDCCSLFF